MIYDGTSAHLEATFTDQSGLAADPAGLLYSLTTAGALLTADQTDPAVTHPATGVYVWATPALATGTWSWQVESTGAQPRMTGGTLLVWPEPISEAPATALARARLAAMIDAETDPIISVEEVELLLDASKKVDLAGLEPADAGWSPTYALGLAAAEAWTWKAGRVAGRVDVADEAAKLSRSQAQAAFLRMAQAYRQRPMSVIVLARPYSQRLDAGVAEAWRPLMGGAQGPTHLGPPYESPLALPGAAVRGDNTA